MYSRLVRYGAVAAKVRTMYGRILSQSDWQTIGESRSLREVVELIRGFPGWAEAAESIPPGCRDVRLIESALHIQLESEYERIFRFATREDKRFLLFAVYRSEYRRVLSALRRLAAPRAPEEPEPAVGPAEGRSRIKLGALASAQSLADIVDACEGSIYADVLKTLPRDGVTGKPDYASAHMLLENCYYSAVWRYLWKSYRGSARRGLIETVGREADFLNLTHIMRLRRRFPDSLPELERLLVPIRYRLTDEFIESLANAPTDGEAMELLRASRWARYFKDDSLASTDHSYELGLEAFCRRQIHAAEPTLCVPQAYLTVKSIECDRLTRVVEAARYGLPVTKVM